MHEIKLYNGVSYPIADYATPDKVVIFLNAVSAHEVLETLTEENLFEIRFLTDSGMVTGIYYNKLLRDHTENGNTLTVSINDADLCRYGLVLNEENRIVDAPVQRYAPDDAVIVDTLPEGRLLDYLYVNGEYIYDPLPKPLTFPLAPRNISEGEYVTIGGVLYKAITNIPNGEPIVEGQNAVATTIEEQLAELAKGE